MRNIPVLLIAIFFVFECSCAGHDLAGSLTITRSTQLPSKALILLIHGAAPLNKNGRIPVSDNIIYAKTNMYRDLAEALNVLGWDVARYSKYGVYDDHIDYEQYKKTDMNFTLKQLRQIWGRLPKDKPLVVFAESEGTLHAPHLPLQEAHAVILLGAVATNIGDVLLDRFDSKKERTEMQGRLNNAFKMKRDEMWGKSHPAGRIVDELNLAPNWTYYEKFKNIPMLILHGEKDEEVKLYQSNIWKEKLPNNDITTVTRPNGNHVFGVGESFDAKTLAKTINGWLDQKKL